MDEPRYYVRVRGVVSGPFDFRANAAHFIESLQPPLHTVAAIESEGLDVRRVRNEPSPGGAGGQAFFRLGEVVLEVIEYAADSPRAEDGDAPARLWGLALAVDSLERCAEVLGDRLAEPRDAVQTGRRIATLRRSAGLAIPIAFMTHGPRAA